LKEKVEAEHERYKSEGGGDSEEPNYFPGNVGGKRDVLVQLVGNETITTADDIARVDEKQTINGVTLSLNKAGSITKLIGLNAKAERLGMPVVFTSEEGGDGVFASHLAVGLKASQYKAGGLLAGNFVESYNELLRIGEKDEEIGFVGAKYLNVKE